MARETLPADSLRRLSEGLAGAVESGARSVVAIHARPRIPSSGVVWRAGVVAAADHTIRRDDNITIQAGDRTVAATLAGRDPSTDVAVLTFDAKDAAINAAMSAATLGDSDALQAGHIVLALGRPGDTVTASFGVISAVAGTWRTGRGGEIDRLIRLDLGIRDGFSGGPLIDTAGAVVGLNTSWLARGQPITIPVRTVDRVVTALLAAGKIARGFLGVAAQSVRLPDAVARELGIEETRALILVGVEPNSPASRAGLLLGDVLVTVDGQTVRDPARLLALLGPDSIGRTLRASILRAGARRDVEVTVGERGAAA